MGRVRINSIDDLDILDELYGGTEKIKNGKKNNNETDLHRITEAACRLERG